VVNSGHRDFAFATCNHALQLRSLGRLYVKDLVLKNFRGLPVEQLTERMIELSLYLEEKLKPACYGRLNWKQARPASSPVEPAHTISIHLKSNN
jgi:hypothetical protein